MTHRTRRRTHHRGPWLIDDDGIIDPISIDLTATGNRRVRLTPTERRLAAAVILARGGTVHDVARRLHIGHDKARRLCVDLTRGEAAA